MTIDEKTLIKLITEEVIKQLGQGGTKEDSTPQPLFVLSGERAQLPQLPGIIDQLRRREEKLRIFLGETDLTPCDLPADLQDWVVSGECAGDVEKILQQSSKIILPWLPLAVLSRLVSLQPGCHISLLLTKALFQGQRIMAQKIFINPYLDFYQKQPLQYIHRKIRGLVQEGKQMGIHWLAEGELYHLINEKNQQEHINQRLLTAADIADLRHVGEVVIGSNTIVTPLAKDELKRHGIQVRRN